MELLKGVEVNVEGSKAVLALAMSKEGMGEVSLAVKVEIVTILEKLVADTSNKLDDEFVKMFKKAMGL